jgi:hypothetical protein
VPLHSRMRGFDRDLIRGKHYGQRSCEPHLKAEHMAAPTKSATRRFFLPTRSRPHMAQSGHQFGLEAKEAGTLYATFGRRMPLRLNSPTGSTVTAAAAA